jgi:hypothetical protein
MVIVALLVTIIAGKAGGQSDKLSLPRAIRTHLDRNYRGWGFPKIAPEWKEYFANRKDGTVPHLVKGDFDGNRKIDYALLIVHEKVVNSTDQDKGRHSMLIVFLAGRGGYRPILILSDVYSPEIYLGLARKGEEDYNIHTQRKFKYTADAVVVIQAEKTAESFLYLKGKFRRIPIGD